jgi:hypothetical protein
MKKRGSKLAKEDELRWSTKRGVLRYIPPRYQALAAVIVSALLYFNAFQVMFEPSNAHSSYCGSLMRPAVTRTSVDFEADWTYEGGELVRGVKTSDVSTYKLGWIWESAGALFSSDTDVECRRTISSLWWELWATFGGLAICGLVLRRAIRRENAAISASGQTT